MHLFRSTTLKILLSAFFVLFLNGCMQTNNTQSTSPTLQDTKERLREMDRQFLKSDYTIAVNLPSNWIELPVTMSTEGYTKSFVPKTEVNPINRMQSVIIHFFRNEKRNLDTAALQFISEEKSSNTFRCKIDADVKDQSTQSITFVIKKTQCQLMSVTDTIQVHKMFGMSDGIYSISYHAQLKNVSKENISYMASVIESAKIVKK